MINEIIGLIVTGNRNNNSLNKTDKYRWKVGDKCMAKYWEDNMVITCLYCNVDERSMLFCYRCTYDVYDSSYAFKIIVLSTLTHTKINYLHSN